MRIPKFKPFHLKSVSGYPNPIDHQNDSVKTCQPLFMFSDAVEHFDKKIYGIPLDAHFVLDIEPLSDKPVIKLHKLIFPERDYVMDGKKKVVSSSGSSGKEGNIILGGDERTSLSFMHLKDIPEGPYEREILFKDFTPSVFKTRKPERHECKDKEEYEEKLKKALETRLSIFIPTFESSSISLLQWSRGLSVEESRSVFMMSFYHHRHLAFKNMGTELMFFYVGFNPERKEWEEKQTFSFSDNESLDYKIPSTFLETTQEFFTNSDFSEGVEDTGFELDYFKKNTYDRLIGRASHLDYIFCEIDYRIYGLAWYATMLRGGRSSINEDDNSISQDDSSDRIFPIILGNSEGVGTIKGTASDKVKISPKELGDVENHSNPFISTQLTPKPLRYSMTSYGSFELGNKFSMSIEYDGSIYGIPNYSSSILKINPDEIYEGSPKITRFGELDDVVVGQQSFKFEGAVKTPRGLFLVPYNASRFLRITGQDCLETTLEEFVGPRKFRSGVYCEALSSVILAPFDYPECLLVSDSNEVRSLYHFDAPLKLQEQKYSDIVKYNDNNYFCIPFARRAILHINIDGQIITCREYPLDPNQILPFFLKGIYAQGAIYCIPFHGNSVLKIFMRGEEVVLENYLLPGADYSHRKFSDAILLDEDAQVIVCVPFNFDKILSIKPGSPPAFKYVSPFTTIKDKTLEKTTDLFITKNRLANKFRTACMIGSEKVAFIPHSYNKFIFINKKHFLFDKSDAKNCSFSKDFLQLNQDDFLESELEEASSNKNEFINYTPSRMEMFCGAHKREKSIFVIPNTETAITRIRFEE